VHAARGDGSNRRDRWWGHARADPSLNSQSPRTARAAKWEVSRGAATKPPRNSLLSSAVGSCGTKHGEGGRGDQRGRAKCMPSEESRALGPGTEDAGLLSRHQHPCKHGSHRFPCTPHLTSPRTTCTDSAGAGSQVKQPAGTPFDCVRKAPSLSWGRLWPESWRWGLVPQTTVAGAARCALVPA
jgi:hypothetical protein